CSFQCFQQVEMKSCCPGYWGPDCTCSVGFVGTACEDCSPGRYGSTCSSCSCVHGLCSSGLKGDGRCTCFSGYRGPRCDQLPECAALSCQQNSRCMEEALTGRLVCQCLPGYEKSGSQCLAKNPCLRPVCHSWASCAHTGPDQHHCTCNQGYSGDGQVCMPIDPCQTQNGRCSARTTRCIYDGPGKSHCECLPGFETLADGSCNLKDVCKPDSCHQNANCSTVGPGRVCACLQGYIGNGKVCFGNIMERLRELNTQPGKEWSGQLSNAISLFPFTVFVPVNRGFKGTSIQTLTADSSKAKYLCKMHLVAGSMPSSTLMKTDVFYTLSGKAGETEMSGRGGQIRIRIHGSRKRGEVIKSDLAASNGLVHIITKLMDSVPATVESRPDENLMKIISDYGKLETFKSLLEGRSKLTEFLRNHIVPSTSLEVYNIVSSPTIVTMANQVLIINVGQILVNGAAVLEAAVEAKNGRLYVMNGVLTPPSIQPLLPHRCDITETPACCKGFYGPDCSPCPGGFNTPCSGRGQCVEGIRGNGSCICEPNFRGSRCQYCSSFNKYGPNCDRCPCVHGQCDNRPDSDGRCKLDSCLRGFTGRFCERQTSVCGGLAQFCHAHADCDFTDCVCKAGFQGDGITCVESDPCAPPLRGGCSVNAKCIKTGPGTHTCQCLTGWTEDGNECQPINNCDGPDGGGCHPNASCIYVGPGQSDCACKAGYMGNGHACEAVNQCVTANGGCHFRASCLLLSSQWTCVCDDGYAGDGLLCYGLQEYNLTKEIELAEEFTVFAPTDSAITQYLFVNDAQINSSNLLCGKGVIHGLSAVLHINRNRCDKERRCCEGFFGEHCEPCPGPKGQACFGNGLCSDGVNGTGVCKCNKDFHGTACESCQSGKYGVHCDQCRCKNGLCNEGLNGDGTCECDVGWRGVRCDEAAGFEGNGTFCKVDPCLVKNGGCSLSGVCKRTRPGSRDCVCGRGYAGDGFVCVNPCLEGNGGCHAKAECIHVGPNKKNGGCHHFAQCNMTGPGIRTCTCSENFVGDGFKCKSTNLTDVAERHGYKTFYKLLKDTGVMDLIDNVIFHPVTIFLPSDDVMASLPQQQKEFLFHQQNRAQLQEYLKYHVMISQKGEIYVNDGSCRITERHLVFRAGIAYGIDCLLIPPSLGGRCDEQTVLDLKNCDLPTLFVSKNSGCQPTCTINFWHPKCCSGFYGRNCLCPGGVHSPCSKQGKCDDGHLGTGTCTCDTGFKGTACEMCREGFYGPGCNCSDHGSCDDGLQGTGLCFCDEGWTGERCDIQQPACSSKAVCQENNTCICRPFHVGDGVTCTVDMCKIWNGGCAREAKCSQREEKVSCTCPQDHSGDGFTCLPVDPCASGDNGGCSEHATCTMTAPGKKRCTCKDNYMGDGVSCELKQLPISRCLLDNGGCHPDATCTDLHFEATLGVFHYRSAKGQYKLDYTAAQQGCRAEGATLANYTQLSYAQQGGLNMCAAGWLDQARVAYPTTYFNPNCGFGHVGIVDYGTRKNLSETWDAFCYRMKVLCVCKPGYIGDGLICTGNLLQVLRSTPTFSNFLIQILKYSEVSESGRRFVKSLSKLEVQSTLFVPENSGLPENLAHQAGMGVGVVLLILLVVGAIFVGCRFYHHSSKPFQFHYFK
uniref:Stabilin 2 n=1 Tax=Xiphophorus maculatus TaxID=8083 RepID=M4A4Z0_XIPMA